MERIKDAFTEDI